MAEAAVAVVLAAGVGSRVGDELPKQFLDLNGSAVLTRTVAALAGCRRLVVVHHPQHAELTRELVEPVCPPDRLRLVPGGSTRRLSVSAALAALDDLPDDVPLVLQNAASPCTPPDLVEQCVDALRDHAVVQAYVPAQHTVFTHEAGELTEVLPRSRLGYSTDPTVYRLGVLRRISAAQAADVSQGEMTLDTARTLGIAVGLVVSPDTNLKLTTPNDLVVLRAITGPAPAPPA